MLHRLRRVRKMTYVLWAWCLLIIVWAVSATTGTGKQAADCVRTSGGYLSTHDCTSAVQAGQGAAVLLILLVGFFGFVFFSIIWFMTRPRAVTS